MSKQVQEKIDELNDLLPGQHSYTKLDDQIGSLILDNKRHPKAWYLFVGLGALGALMLLTSITWLVFQGIGIWGNNQPVGWGFDIINFVWWIGIGHAGTLISAVLLLVRQQWRNSINRFA